MKRFAKRNIRWDFSGESVLVTGAARGQGRSHALAFAKAGANVAICDIASPIETLDYAMATPDELSGVAEEIEALGVRCQSFHVDVRDRQRVAEMFDDVATDFDGLAVLVANAGVNGIHEATSIPAEVWRDVVDINLNGTFNCVQHAAQIMVEQNEGGSIVCTGSVNSLRTMPHNAHYTASKHGLQGMVKGFAIDLAEHGITVNMVAPGLVDTAILGCAEAPQVPDDYFEKLIGINGSWNLLGAPDQPIDAEQVTGAVLWLASDSAAAVTGATIPVDCGFLAK